MLSSGAHRQPVDTTVRRLRRARGPRCLHEAQEVGNGTAAAFGGTTKEKPGDRNLE